MRGWGQIRWHVASEDYERAHSAIASVKPWGSQTASTILQSCAAPRPSKPLALQRALAFLDVAQGRHGDASDPDPRERSIEKDDPAYPGVTNKAYWNDLAVDDGYDKHIFSTNNNDEDGEIFKAIDEAAARARSIKGADVLAVDAGCGPGKWLAALSKRFSRVVGIDLSPGLLQIAESKVKSQGLSNVKLAPATDLGRPCQVSVENPSASTLTHRDRCGTLPESVGRPGADVVTSINDLISPDPNVRSRILRREADMLNPTPSSTLLLVVPSVASYKHQRDEYRRLASVREDLGNVVDLSVDNASEEAKDIFRANGVRTQFFTEKSICAEVETAGLQCAEVRKVPFSWEAMFQGLSGNTLGQLRPPAPHLLLVVAHPRGVRPIADGQQSAHELPAMTAKLAKQSFV